MKLLFVIVMKKMERHCNKLLKNLNENVILKQFKGKCNRKCICLVLNIKVHVQHNEIIDEGT